jgi:hypothetical protein
MRGPRPRAVLLRGRVVSAVTNPSSDWLGDRRASLLAWGLPHAALIAGLFLAVPPRAAVWTVALAWMGIACLFNARRCGRTHCRYTGPYYLVMIVPVILLGSGSFSAGVSGWLLLGAVIVGGAALIWRASERARGKFS